MATKPFPGPGATVADEPRLFKQLDFVLHYMANGGWHTFDEIQQAYTQATGKTMLQTSASAHLRALRREEHGGYTVERQPTNTPGLFQYRIVTATPQRIRQRLPPA